MTGPSAVREFPLPDLGEGLTEAEVLTWLVAVGDTVHVDQPVAEVETAKAVVEVPCPFHGTVTALHGAPGETVAVGAPLISVDTAPARPATGFAEPGVAVPEARGSAEGGGPVGGAAPEGTGSGAVLVGYGTAEERPRRSRGARRAPRPPRPGAGAAPRGRVPVVSPLVRRLAREHGLDVAAIAGSGEGGLVLRRDVESAIAVAGERATPAGAAADAERPGVERIPLRGARRTMVERLSRSRREIPEATVWVDADATGLLRLRSALNEAAPDRPVSLLALLARFCVLGLARFPALNSQVDADRAEVVRFAHVNLGFAAQTPRGLLVPVVHDAHRMSARELSAELTALTDAARAGTLPPGRLTGGTFTVNNYGVFGVDGSAAIINHPEAAILGMGRIVRRPWVPADAPDTEDAVRARLVTELTLTFDHRVCDGAEAGGFLRFVADCVERPELLLGDL
ncbi:dihydrolipoamide acetyltransferase family protein [Marinactinospora rubrisoli]|uniref:Dihydrolipoamide acetyltransferase component of pyruvate dehydrogenase complex n=1 Tax=Marinactinospora rubrisoli TaxID=2715399 RepID=A0ABW2KKV2_9ACTN